MGTGLCGYRRVGGIFTPPTNLGGITSTMRGLLNCPSDSRHLCPAEFASSEGLDGCIQPEPTVFVLRELGSETLTETECYGSDWGPCSSTEC